ncbi:hypothetical protein D3C76_1442540 [compost metagenome]
MFNLPCLENLVVATLGFNYLTGVGIPVHLDRPLTALRMSLSSTATAPCTARIRFQNGHDIAERFSILAHQASELCFKLNFFLEARVVLEGLKVGQLLGQCSFGSAELCKL